MGIFPEFAQAPEKRNFVSGLCTGKLCLVRLIEKHLHILPHPVRGKNHPQSSPSWNSPLDPLFGKTQMQDVTTGSRSHPIHLEHSMISDCVSVCVYEGQHKLPIQTSLLSGRFGTIIVGSCFPKLSWSGGESNANRLLLLIDFLHMQPVSRFSVTWEGRKTHGYLSY